MKTYKRLYSQICDFENIYRAWRRARKGKRRRAGPAAFEICQEEELLSIQEELRAHTYAPGAYRSFYIHDPKKRLISAAPFRDRVVHHALCQVIEPIWEQRFIYDSYANRVNKGTHKALDRATSFARHHRYVLQCDIRQFFPSVDLLILRSELARRIHDGETLWLCDRILESGLGVLSEEYEMKWFPGDDLFAVNRARGLPIGNLTSQFLANVFLNDFDHFIKRELKCQAYLRYVDDFLLFSDDTRTLLKWRQVIIERMASIRLTLHEESAQVFPTATGIPFLGFRLYPDHRLLKRRKAVQYRRKLRRLLEQYACGSIVISQIHASIQGWINHIRYGDTWGLRCAVLGGKP